MTDEETIELDEGEIVLVACRVVRSSEASMDGEGGLLDIDGELHMVPIFGNKNFYVESHTVVRLPYQPNLNDWDAEAWERETERLSKALNAGEPGSVTRRRGNLGTAEIGGEV